MYIPVMDARMNAELNRIIDAALAEDLGPGDVTSTALFPDEQHLQGKFVAKSPGIIAGIELAGMIYRRLQPQTRFRPEIRDAASVQKGDTIASVEGPGVALLGAERVVLNFMQRMSGIATTTRGFVEAVAGTKARILDTRKTAPGLRAVDKWAVRIGGGQNHRHGLYDMILLKENHIAAAGGPKEAVKTARERSQPGIAVELEVRNLEELREAIGLDLDRIMLDNMKVTDLREAVQIAAGRVPLEASGNITLENVVEIAETGVDFISVGMLTHSVKALDISFLISRNGKDVT